MIYQIKSPYFTAGITFVNDKADKAAPIIKYMIGWTLDAVKSYCNKKRWDIAGIKGAYGMKQSEHCIIQYKGFWSACQFLLFGDKKNSVTHYKNHCLVCMKPISELDKCPIAENKERVE